MNWTSGCLQPPLAIATGAGAAALAMLTFAVPNLYTLQHPGLFGWYVRGAFLLGAGLGLASALLTQRLWARILGATALFGSLAPLPIASLRF